MPSENIRVQVHREIRLSPLDLRERNARTDDWEVHPLVKEYTVHDDVDRSILESFLRCTSIGDRDIRMQALRMFHEAQLARWNGGPRAMILGYRLGEFLEFYEQQQSQEVSS